MQRCHSYTVLVALTQQQLTTNLCYPLKILILQGPPHLLVHQHIHVEHNGAIWRNYGDHHYYHHNVLELPTRVHPECLCNSSSCFEHH